MKFATPPPSFPHLELRLQELTSPEFLKLSSRKKFKQVSLLLLSLIESHPDEAFLLPQIVDYIDRINQQQVLSEPYTITIFEFWLNHYTNLDEQAQAKLRGKVVGKWIPRDEYQRLFPIGMGKYFFGSHFVAAHLTPDVDTMIASFWGWVDAFGAKVGTGQHFWNLPGGPPDTPVTRLFEKLFGKNVFNALARTISTLTLTSMDLLTNRNVYYKPPGTSISTLDHSDPEKAIILTDSSKHFLGDWRSTDVETARQVIVLFKSCLRWFESNLQMNLISLFANEQLSRKEIPPFLQKVFDVKILECEPYQEFTRAQKETISEFIIHVLSVKKGTDATFRDLAVALSEQGAHELQHFIAELETLINSPLFDASGQLVASRPLLFETIQKILKEFDYAIHHIRDFSERLDVVIKIKHAVVETPSYTLNIRSDVDDIRLKLRNLDYLAVTISDGKGQAFPLGVVWASDLRKSMLGTVSFRDFCNTDEVKMASYLGVISVIDHHKTSLNTGSTPMVIISDAQSCNVLIAEIAFEINDIYSTAGMSAASIDAQLEDLEKQPPSETTSRITQRLLLKKQNAQNRNDYFITPEREYCEYFLFLHAILDDTDLLTKMSKRDVDCVVQLLNRMKTLTSEKECETVNTDDIPLDENFAKTASKRILQNADMHAIYNEIFLFKESEVATGLKLASEGKMSGIFSDTKEQNGCCRISQTKLFSSNYPIFAKYHEEIVHEWLAIGEDVCRNHPEVDLHIHMISTIPSADEVYGSKAKGYDHQDELWFWRPSTQTSYEHLSAFLSNFQEAPEVLKNAMTVEFHGNNTEELKEIFRRNFSIATVVSSPAKNVGGGMPIAILKFKAGSINSRKAMISPYLPKLIA